MPVYTYRREDGTTFDLRQKFTDAPLAVDPESGQRVVRVVQAAGVIFKGSGFYVNDSKGAKSATAVPKASENKTTEAAAPAAPAPAPAPSAPASTAAAAD